MSLYLLRSHIIDGSNVQTCLGQFMGFVSNDFRDSKVQDFHHAVLIDNDISGLDVSMNDSFRVRMLAGCSNLLYQFDGKIFLNRMVRVNGYKGTTYNWKFTDMASNNGEIKCRK